MRRQGLVPDRSQNAYTEDGILTFSSGTSQGREAIRATVTKFAEGISRFYHTEDGKPGKLRHAILQSAIRVEGNRAWGRSLWLEMANHGPQDTMKMGPTERSPRACSASPGRNVRC